MHRCCYVGSIVEHVIDAHMRGRIYDYTLIVSAYFFLFYCVALLVIMIYDLISIYITYYYLGAVRFFRNGGMEQFLVGLFLLFI
jgi:hypothetical protein